jgi:metal-responsive CopG/Arc/MetJ family transcriptional regulator
MNGAKYKNVTVQLEPDLLARVDEKAERADLNRSQYLRRLVRKDLGVPQLELGFEASKPEAVPA